MLHRTDISQLLQDSNAKSESCEKKKCRRAYLVTNWVESNVTELIKVFIHVWVWQVTADESTVDDSVRASQAGECASGFEPSKVVEETLNC